MIFINMHKQNNSIPLWQTIGLSKQKYQLHRNLHINKCQKQPQTPVFKSRSGSKKHNYDPELILESVAYTGADLHQLTQIKIANNENIKQMSKQQMSISSQLKEVTQVQRQKNKNIDRQTKKKLKLLANQVNQLQQNLKQISQQLKTERQENDIFLQTWKEQLMQRASNNMAILNDKLITQEQQLKDMRQKYQCLFIQNEKLKQLTKVELSKENNKLKQFSLELKKRQSASSQFQFLQFKDDNAISIQHSNIISTNNQYQHILTQNNRIKRVTQKLHLKEHYKENISVEDCIDSLKNKLNLYNNASIVDEEIQDRQKLQKPIQFNENQKIKKLIEENSMLRTKLKQQELQQSQKRQRQHSQKNYHPQPAEEINKLKQSSLLKLNQYRLKIEQLSNQLKTLTQKYNNNQKNYHLLEQQMTNINRQSSQNNEQCQLSLNKKYIQIQNIMEELNERQKQLSKKEDKLNYHILQYQNMFEELSIEKDEYQLLIMEIKNNINSKINNNRQSYIDQENMQILNNQRKLSPYRKIKSFKQVLPYNNKMKPTTDRDQKIKSKSIKKDKIERKLAILKKNLNKEINQLQ